MFGGNDDNFNANGKDYDDDDWKKELSDDSDFEPTKSSQETKKYVLTGQLWNNFQRLLLDY